MKITIESMKAITAPSNGMMLITNETIWSIIIMKS